jgi:hypothetical protein
MNIYGKEIDPFDIVVFVIIIIAIFLLWYYLSSDSNNVLILDHSQDATVFTKYTQTSTVTYDFACSGWVNIDSWDDTISPNLFTICSTSNTLLTTSNYKFVDSMNSSVSAPKNIITYSPATYTLTSTVFIISSSGKYQLRSATKTNTYLFLSDNYGVSNWDLVNTPITTTVDTSLKCAMSDDSKYITIIYTDAAFSYCWSLNSNSILTPPVKKITATTEKFIDISMSSDGQYQTVITTRITTGTLTASTTSITITGTGTKFTSDLEVGDVIFTNGNAIIGTIATIASDTSATLENVAATAVSSAASYNTSGRIYISDDYGSTWTKINKKTEIWKNVYVSSNGKCQVATTSAAAPPYNIYVSQNYGLDTSWNLVRDIIEAPISFAMSSDGAYQYVLTIVTGTGGTVTGYIYSSTESGVDGSWIKKADSNIIVNCSIATSSNGQTVVISSGVASSTTNSILYMSFDYGNTFIYNSSFVYNSSLVSGVATAYNIRLTGSGNDIYYTNNAEKTYKISNGGGDTSSRSVDCTPYIGVTLDNSCNLILNVGSSAFAPIARIPTQRWVHILININGDNTIVPTKPNPIDIYINGDLVSTKFSSTVLSLSSAHDYYVGGGTRGTTASSKVSDVTTSGYAGKIRDVKITLKSCTPQEVYDMYKKGISKSFFEDLLSYKLKFSLLTDNKESSSATI